ncbi:MAG: hypothetical protein JRL30_00840 [Deltaproteobacteria bacterium]|nr:hypothetical protein [Deltaproteobacteria bacterium]
MALSRITVTQEAYDLLVKTIEVFSTRVEDPARTNEDVPLCIAYHEMLGDCDDRCPVHKDLGRRGCRDMAVSYPEAEWTGVAIGKVLDYFRGLRDRCVIETEQMLFGKPVLLNPKLKAGEVKFGDLHVYNCAVDPPDIMPAADPIPSVLDGKPTHRCPKAVKDAISQSIHSKWAKLIEDPMMDEPLCDVCDAVDSDDEGCKNCLLKRDGQGCGEDTVYGRWSAVRDRIEEECDGDADEEDMEELRQKAREMHGYLKDLWRRCFANDLPAELDDRLKLVKVSFEVFAMVLERGTGASEILDPVSEPKIMRCFQDPTVPDVVVFVVRSPDFPALLPGSRIPVMDVNLETRDDAKGLRTAAEKVLADLYLAPNVGYVQRRMIDTLKAAIDEEAKR